MNPLFLIILKLKFSLNFPFIVLAQRFSFFNCLISIQELSFISRILLSANGVSFGIVSPFF